MKQTYIFCLLFLSLFSSAQIINFPDANFKTLLLMSNSSTPIAKNSSGVSIKIDANSNNEIEISEALNVYELRFNYVSNITDITGINNFTNLKSIIGDSNLLQNVDLSSLNNLIWVTFNWNNISDIIFPNTSSLVSIVMNGNQLTNLNLSNLHNLDTLFVNDNNLVNMTLPNSITALYCSGNDFTTVDVSHCRNLTTFGCSYSPNLVIVNVKNGAISNLSGLTNQNPSLRYVCADQQEVDMTYTNQYFEINSYCTFNPGGAFYNVLGQSKIDLNNDGCDISDINYPNLKLNFLNNFNYSYNYISNNSGNYLFPVQAGQHTITPILENPNYFTVSPTNVIIDFPTQTSPLTQNFCITPNGVKHDVEVSIIPITVARPGFDATYKIIYKNKGNQEENGTINLLFDDAVLDVVTSTPILLSQSLNNLNWTYNNLQPFETREIIVVLNVNSPMETPAVNTGYALNYAAQISQLGIDEMLYDNAFGLKQTVLNSYDPNDKTCLQGNTISPDKVGEFVHYMIRFENTGTFPAENIVVKDMIDTAKFDVSSLISLNASHNYVTKIIGNKVEFIFENINLPFDDATNDGYIAFKIKTLPSLVLGDTFSNSANIYFDYNFPIVTNTATTTIAALSNPSFEFANYFSLYPNPTTNELNINLKSAIEINSIQIYNTIGQLVTVQTGNALKVDVSNLKTGNYFIKINTNEGFSTSQFIKK